MIPRYLFNEIVSRLSETQKVIILYGARQTGKTTLCNQVIREMGMKTFKVNADQAKYTDLLSSRDLNKMVTLVDGYDMIFIDEAHRIPDIGINLKILHDEYPALRILVTGSSSFELAKKVSEPLTGRKVVFQLFPVAFSELRTYMNPFELNEHLADTLIFGSYPEVFSITGHRKKMELLTDISNSYLFKDILESTAIRNRNKLRDLLKLLAFQIGSEVSLHELGKTLGMNRETIENYIRLLEESFIIFRLSGFSRNLRKEISKMDKFYFYDLGIRNILINNLNELNMRNDTGQLWENFIISERLKLTSYKQINVARYFWRTYTGAEMDYVEEREGKLFGYEIKFKKERARTPHTWKDVYAGEFELVNRENYLGFVV